jgi:hypothetical protein
MKLKGLYKFGIVYEEHKGHIPYLLKLCSEAKKEGISIGQLVKLAKLVDENTVVSCVRRSSPFGCTSTSHSCYGLIYPDDS